MTSKQDKIQSAWWKSDTAKRLLACLVGGLLAAALWWMPVVGGVLRDMEVKTRDAFVRMDTRVRPREDFVFLAIDSASLRVSGVDDAELSRNVTLQRMRGQLPWDRRVYAEAIDRLAGAGARLIILDIILAQDGTAEEDESLARAIAKHRDKVVLASAFSPVAMGEGRDSVQVVEPAEVFLGSLEDETSFGFANFWPDDDGVIRVSRFQRTLSEANGKEAHPDEFVYESLAAVAARKLGKVPPRGAKRFRMGVADKSLAVNSYEPLSLVSIFIEKEWRENYANGKFFKDKVVIIGPALPMLHDDHMTVGGKIYGAQLHLQVLAAILDDAWYNEVQHTTWLIAILCFLGVVAAMVAAFWMAKPLHLFLSILAAWILIGVVMLAAMWWMERLTGVVVFGFVFSSGILAAIIWQAMTDRIRRQELHRHLQRSMSPDVADAIVRAPEGYYAAASGNRREVTVLFSDVRGFTSRSEKQDAVELVSQLNEYLGKMVEVVFAHGGTVDKFIGDAIMVTWGGLGMGDVKEQNQLAADTAVDMLDVLKDLNARWKTKGLEPFQIGIGIHQGEAIVGEVGSDQRTDFTVIGDAVNLASRIEGMTKAMGLDLLLSATMVSGLADADAWTNVGTVRVKGKEDGVTLFTRISASDTELGTLERALQFFRDGDFADAMELFASLRGKGALARLAEFYMDQIQWQSKGSNKAPDGWDGILSMKTK